MTIKGARQAANLTQAEAAKLLGVSKRTVEEWESGNRNPKFPEDKILEAYGIAGMLTGEGRQALLDGEVSLEEMIPQYKLHECRKLSRWGKYPDTFAANWERIPAAIVETASPEALAVLVDSIKDTYDEGVEHGKGLRD